MIPQTRHQQQRERDESMSSRIVSRMFVCLAAVCLSVLFFTGCENYEYTVTWRNCDYLNCRIRVNPVAICKNDKGFMYPASIYPFLKKPLEEITFEWSLWYGTDWDKAPSVFGQTCLSKKMSFPAQNVYYYEKTVRVNVPEFIKSGDLAEILFDCYHGKIIVAYRTKKELPDEEYEKYASRRHYCLEDGTPYDYRASNFPEYFKKHPTATEEDYMKEQRRLYDAFREKFPGKTDIDFLMFLRFVQRAPMLEVDAENDPMMPMIERDVKYGSYVIPDWMKPYENTPL